MPIEVPRGRPAYRTDVSVKKSDIPASDEQIGERIRAAREAEGLTQGAVGARMGLGQNSVSDYELGKTPFTVDTLRRFGVALETEWRFFVEGPQSAKVPNKAKHTVEQFLYGLSRSGWRRLNALTTEERQELARQVEALLAAKPKPLRARKRKGK